MPQFPGVLSRRLTRPALVAVGVLALAGCSSGADAAAPPSGAGSAPTSAAPASAPAATPEPTASASSGQTAGGSASGPAAGPGRCHAGELTAALEAGDAGAGQRGATVVLTNTGGRTCDVEGFGGVGLQDAAGRALPTEQVRVGAGAPALVPVPPGASVRSQLQWTVVPGDADPAPGCPTPASLAVIPPDEEDAVSVDWSLGPVCGGGRLEQRAYVAG